MFQKIAEYFRQGKSAKALKLLEKTLQASIQEDRLNQDFNFSLRKPRKYSKKKKTPTKV